MAGRVVGRIRRTGQDELACSATVVASSPHGVPDVRRELPFIEQPRDRPRQRLARRDLRSETAGGRGIERDFATGKAATGPRLAARTRPFDYHRRRRGQCFSHLAVDDALTVSRRCQLIGHRCSTHRKDGLAGRSTAIL